MENHGTHRSRNLTQSQNPERRGFQYAEGVIHISPGRSPRSPGCIVAKTHRSAEGAIHRFTVALAGAAPLRQAFSLQPKTIRAVPRVAQKRPPWAGMKQAFGLKRLKRLKRGSIWQISFLHALGMAARFAGGCAGMKQAFGLKRLKWASSWLGLFVAAGCVACSGGAYGAGFGLMQNTGEDREAALPAKPRVSR